MYEIYLTVFMTCTLTAVSEQGAGRLASSIQSWVREETPGVDGQASEGRACFPGRAQQPRCGPQAKDLNAWKGWGKRSGVCERKWVALNLESMLSRAGWRRTGEAEWAGAGRREVTGEKLRERAGDSDAQVSRGLLS